MQTIALILFVITYVLMITLSEKRPYVALVSAVAYVLLGIGLGLTQPLSSMVMGAYSRHAEYRADRQAVEEGYGDAMVTGLKKLAKENFAHLAPAKLQVVLEYGHPPLSQRVEALEKAIKE